MSKYLSFALLLLCGIIYFQYRNTVRLTEERNRYRSNSTALLSETRRLRIDSTTMAIDVQGLHLTVDEYKRFRAKDAETIKRLGVKVKNLESVARHEIEVKTPIDTEVKDTLVVRDTLPAILPYIEVNTPYIRFSGLIENHRLKGQIHVPITLHQTVWIEYKRFWIFWKKPKAIHQTIYSDNPHVNLTYSEYIQIK